LLLGDDVLIYQLTGGTTPMSLFGESILATALQTEFILSETPTGVILSSLNGATLPSYVFTVVDDTITYHQDANDGYEIQAGDVLTFIFLNGTAGTKTLNDVSVIASEGQVAFYLPTLATGEIIASINGALVPPSAFTVSGTRIGYSSTLNGNYKLKNGDIVTFTYLTESSIADEWARMSVSVNGVTKILGTRQVSVANQFTIEATDILLLTPQDNVSTSVTHNVEPSLGMVYSSLGSSMIRGIE
jgi:protein involved in polysaccharide export with SLBB domain